MLRRASIWEALALAVAESTAAGRELQEAVRGFRAELALYGPERAVGGR